MLDYEREDDLTFLSPDEKLKIVKKEIDKIISINNLVLVALKSGMFDECEDGLLFAARLVNQASWNILKMFPVN